MFRALVLNCCSEGIIVLSIRLGLYDKSCLGALRASNFQSAEGGYKFQTLRPVSPVTLRSSGSRASLRPHIMSHPETEVDVED